MLGLVKEISGQKTIIPLTTDTGTGAPVGSIIVVCSNILPSGYLGLGVQYDITNYPALYQVLGTDTTPTASALGLPTLSSGQYAIKATSGLAENQQENVLNTINENNSYSTEEHATGKKWIDGKPIYSKVIDCGALPNNTETFTDLNIQNLATVVSLKGMANNGAGTFLPLPYIDSSLTNCVQMAVANNKISIVTNGNRSTFSAVAIVEYTKTTD